MNLQEAELTHANVALQECVLSADIRVAGQLVLVHNVPACVPFDNTLLHQLVRWFFHWDLIFQNNLLSETERTRSGQG